MRVVFLDVDGVLNCEQKWAGLPLARTGEQGSRICPEATERLKRIVDATDARIVVSSTWRYYFMDSLTLWLDRHGIDRARVIGRTPTTRGEARGDEIQGWLDDNPDVTEYAILDDSEVGHLAPRWVQTTWHAGLLDEHVPQAIALLSEGA